MPFPCRFACTILITSLFASIFSSSFHTHIKETKVSYLLPCVLFYPMRAAKAISLPLPPSLFQSSIYLPLSFIWTKGTQISYVAHKEVLLPLASLVSTLGRAQLQAPPIGPTCSPILPFFHIKHMQTTLKSLFCKHQPYVIKLNSFQPKLIIFPLPFPSLFQSTIYLSKPLNILLFTSTPVNYKFKEPNQSLFFMDFTYSI